MAFLRQAAARPHHAYVLAGPEGGGKQLAARAFAAALLCKVGGCGECRDCRLALEDRHPNEVVVEPEGRDIHVETVRSEIWHPAYRTAPEPGRKVFVIREADRLNPAAADVLLKVLEEPPADAVLMLLSARPDELPETVLSRCHVVSFRPLSEGFVAQTLVGRGDRRGSGRARRAPGGREPRPGPAARLRLGRHVVPRDGPRRDRARLAAGRPVPSRRPSSCSSRPSATARTSGRSSRKSSRRSWTNAGAPRRRTAARSAGSRSGTSGRSVGRSGTTWTACCSASPRCCETGWSSPWVGAPRC